MFTSEDHNKHSLITFFWVGTHHQMTFSGCSEMECQYRTDKKPVCSISYPLLYSAAVVCQNISETQLNIS